MFEYLKQRRRIYALIKEVENRSRNRIDAPDIAMIGYAHLTDSFERDRLRASLKLLETERLIKRATKYDVEVPENDDTHWATDQTALEKYLTDKGKKLITRRIRDKRFAFFQRWSPILAILMSLLSLLVAIIAIVKAH
jgi:hypothetical protein